MKHLAEIEDHDVTNQFTAIGTIKPGRFRRWSAMFFLWLLHNACRHVFSRGYLTRVSTIHFARWVFLDNKQRLLFASNYDGSLESYNNDFVDRVPFGLNLVFSNGQGWPRTAFLLFGGSGHGSFSQNSESLSAIGPPRAFLYSPLCCNSLATSAVHPV